MMNSQTPVATASNYYAHHPTSFHHPHAQHPTYHDPALVSLAYRPLHSHHPHHQHQITTNSEAQQTQAQAHLAPPGTGLYQHPSFRQHHSASALSHRTRAQARQQQQRTMAYDQGHQTSDQEIAELQKLSEQYEPEVTGPLVGQRQPSTAITSEYASADPVLQAKTAALPQKYSYYRTVRGDGKCGWRAIAFGYFEALIRLGDGTKFLQEEARLRSMSNIMVQAGFEPMLFDDFADETIDLLRKLNDALPSGNADEFLHEQFNDEMLQNYIITHLRTLTASWMKTHEADYAAFLLGQTVDQYCESSIMPVGAEIDHVGLVALKDSLLSPAGISLEVLYLDRSEGSSEVNMHRFDPVTGGGYTIGTVRLLYRPGHYDILYKPEDLPPPPQQAAVPTYLQYASHSHEPVYDLGVSDFMTSIPGMSYANLSQPSWMSSSYGTAADFFSNSAPVQTCPQPMSTSPAPAPQPHAQSQPVYASASTPTLMVAPPTQMPHELAIRTSVPHVSLAHPDFQNSISDGPFRPSAWQLEPDFMHATSQMPFQTSIFRNSHFNTAHFLNPDFQPEQWDPDDEYATATSSSKGARHRNNG